MPYKLRLPNHPEPTEFLSLGELADFCGRSKDTFKKMIHSGQMPEANFRTQSTTVKKGEKAGDTIRGHRLYSKNIIAPRLKKLFATISQGKKMTDEQKMELLRSFDYERRELILIEKTTNDAS